MDASHALPNVARKGERMNPSESTRVWRRLLHLATWTGVATLRLERSQRRSGSDPHAAIAHGHAWARRLIRALGIELVVHGAPPAGPHLVLANHRSYVDIVAILSQLPCAFLAKAEVERWPLFCRAARLMHTVFVQRDDLSSRKLAREGALTLLQRGVSFAAFPEGTTFRGPGILPFYPGLFRMAEQYDFPIVPVAIEYEDSEDAWVGDGSFVGHFLTAFRKRRMCVRLVFGKPLRAREVDSLLGATRAFIEARVRPAHH
jgi:1-acyl-sn-glycerol-3-phosphate acyltransferase